MKELFITGIFRFCIYVLVGIFMEFMVTGISKLITVLHDKIDDRPINKEDEKLTGYTYLWMIPVYGFFLLLAFEPVFYIVKDFPIGFRYLIWCIAFTGFEFLSGFIYYKIIGFCPWQYQKWEFPKGKGFITMMFVPAWGFAGITIEQITLFLYHLDLCVLSYF